VHDRKIDGIVHTFGNEGALFMNAMTWWDWETESIWSQPWGAAIDGELTGTRLTLLPYELVPWQTWSDRHPTTKVLVDERGDFDYMGRLPKDDFVIGVSIGDSAMGFYFTSSANDGVVNEFVGDYPVVVFTDSDTREIDVFLRGPRRGHDTLGDVHYPLTFELISANSPHIRDAETGSIWDIERGVSIEGTLKGTILQRAPYVSAFDWAWQDFNPHSQFWGDPLDKLD
jgi:hypothetical protein